MGLHNVGKFSRTFDLSGSNPKALSRGVMASPKIPLCMQPAIMENVELDGMLICSLSDFHVWLRLRWYFFLLNSTDCSVLNCTCAWYRKSNLFCNMMLVDRRHQRAESHHRRQLKHQWYKPSTMRLPTDSSPEGTRWRVAFSPRNWKDGSSDNSDSREKFIHHHPTRLGTIQMSLVNLMLCWLVLLKAVSTITRSINS